MSSLMRCVNVTARCATLQRSKKLADIGLNGYQHTYVLNICRNPGISQEQLAREIYINKSNVARQVAALENQGFVERRASTQDRRVMLLYPTDKATQALPVIREVLRDFNDYLMQGFSSEEREALEGTMQKIMERAKDYIDLQGGRGGSK